jgi:phage gp29-like protein
MARTPVPYRTAARNAGIARPSPELQQEIATTRDGRDITQPWVRGLREAKDPMLASAVDWGAYDRVFNDDQVYSTMQQRISAVVSRDWTVIAGDDDDPRAQKAADAFDRTLKRLPWDRITRKMLMATFYGYSVSELMWAPRDGLFDIIGIKVRHARRFRYDDENRLRMLTPTNMQGEILPERKFWVHAVGATDDDQPYGQGLAYWLYWPTLFKRNGIRFWNIFLDKFGTPTAKGTYPRGSQPAEINKLLMALQAIATDSGFVVPDGMAVELLSAAKSGTADFHQLCTYMDAAIAKIVLSQTMTTDNGSSRSQSETHAGVKLEVVKTDADDQTDSFTNGTDGQGGPARWWTDWNFGTDVAAPIVRRTVEEEEDTQKTAETDEAHSRLGWVRTADSFKDTYGDGYVRRDDPEAPSGSMPAAAPPPDKGNPADHVTDGKTKIASFAEGDTHDDADSVVDRMIAEDGYRVADAMTGNLIDQLMNADSEIAARAILASALGTMNEAPLIQALERAGFAAQLDASNQLTSNGESNVQ